MICSSPAKNNNKMDCKCFWCAGTVRCNDFAKKRQNDSLKKPLKSRPGPLHETRREHLEALGHCTLLSYATAGLMFECTETHLASFAGNQFESDASGVFKQVSHYCRPTSILHLLIIFSYISNICSYRRQTQAVKIDMTQPRFSSVARSAILGANHQCQPRRMAWRALITCVSRAFRQMKRANTIFNRLSQS